MTVYNLSYNILKNGGYPLWSHLLQLFTLSLSASRVPSAWKTAIVTPVFKRKGSKHLVSNFRPISITSCCSRLFERIISKKINSHIASLNLISDSQHGFTPGKSTDSLFVNFYDYITDCLDKNLVIDCIFFDFRKAFDSVPHSKLMSCLSSTGIRSKALLLLCDLFTDRFQRVRVQGVLSTLLPVSSGVIQGSVLGPTLFNIYINNVDKALTHCKILKYADDTRIFLASTKMPHDLLELRRKVQKDIDSFTRWSLESGLDFNTDKCFASFFGPRSVSFLPPHDYSIAGASIPTSTEFNDLGLVIKSPINFNSYVDKIVAKAFRMLGLINKVFYYKSKKNTVKLYKSYVRPLLEYSSLIWNPYYQTSIDNIERVQRRMCRLIRELHHLPYRQQLESLGLFSLQTRRLRFQLIFLFKMYKGFTNINFDSFFTLCPSSITRGHSGRILPKFSRNNYRLNFFTVQVISYWNQLSQDDIDSPTTSCFKNRLNAFFKRSDLW